MKQYKQSLTGYMLTTAIKDHLDAIDLEHPTCRIRPMQQKELFSKLTCKLKVKITNQSLNYVRHVWKSLAELFSLPIPTLLLREIAERCLEIMWQFPSELVAYVIQAATENKLHFRMRQFLWVSVDGVCIYTESEAQVKHKVGCLLKVDVSIASAQKPLVVLLHEMCPANFCIQEIHLLQELI